MDQATPAVEWWHVALPCLFFLLLWLGTLYARADYRRLNRRLDEIQRSLRETANF